MMAITAVPEGPLASGQLVFTKGSTAAAPAVASALERGSSSATSSPIPLVVVFRRPWPCLKQHAAVHFCRKRFASSLVIQKSGRTAFPTFGLRMGTTVCSAAYGSSNGNGRPGRGFQNSGGGYSPRPITEDLNISKDQSSDSSSSSDQGIELGEAGEGRGRIGRGRPTGSRSPDAQEKQSSSSSRSATEKQQGEAPYRIMENGQKVYLDELDVMTLLEPPPFLRPLKTLYYNHAAFLWKKIGDIPEERRHRLLDLLLPRHISKMWELSKLRYEDPDVSVEHPEDILSISDSSEPSKSALWDGRATNVPWYLSPFSRFQKVFFIGNDQKTYGRVIIGGKFFRPVTDRLAPLYFQVLQVDSVMATEEQCDFALDYGDGQLHLRDSIPAGFAQPGKHVPPFNDNACDYLRAVGPGVIVGQTWIEGRMLEQLPQKWLGEFILVRRYQ